MAACNSSMLQALQQKNLQLHKQCLKGHKMWPVVLLQTEACAQVSLELRLESGQQGCVNLQTTRSVKD